MYFSDLIFAFPTEEWEIKDYDIKAEATRLVNQYFNNTNIAFQQFCAKRYNQLVKKGKIPSKFQLTLSQYSWLIVDLYCYLLNYLIVKDPFLEYLANTLPFPELSDDEAKDISKRLDKILLSFENIYRK